MRIFCSSIIFLFLATPLAAAEINWQVVQPFRFLRFESDHRVHELAHEAARKSDTSFKSRPVSAMEALLNNPTWWEERPEGQAESPRETIEAMRAGEGRSLTRFEPRLGWSSLLRNRADGPVFEGTCWNAYSQSFFGCFSEPGNINGENDYMFPRYHLVRLSVAEDDGSPARQSDCTLSFLDSLAPGSGFLQGGPEDRGSELQSIDFDCGDSVLARIPFDAGLSVGGSADAQPLEAVDVKVTDIVIGSMGDSFASGEGNPDLPAQLDDTSVVRPRYGIDKDGSVDSSVGVPKRQVRPDGRIKGGTAARWIDRRCHRSMYSAHARAAIAVALAGERHHSVTFVSFACSGAEITDGLFWPQDGRECTTGGRAGSRFLEPQISALVGALGQDPRTRC